MNRKPAILAHVDLFSAGAAPCRVVAVRETRDGGLSFDVQLTAARGFYRRGEVLRGSGPRAVIPRGFLRRSRQRPGHFVVWAYDWRAVLAKYGVTPTAEGAV
jgi:hypothetical protein